MPKAKKGKTASAGGRHSELRKLFEAKVESSGLTAEEAEALGMRAFTREQTRELLERTAPEGSTPMWLRRAPDGLRSLSVPYRWPDGRERPEMWRLRRLEDPPAGAFGQADEELNRYAQPAGTAPAAYFPRLEAFGMQPWTEALKDSKRAILFTEGELKSARACKAGFLCVGLGGVWSWKSKKEALHMLPELLDLPLAGRECVLVFDSDAATNPDVAAAMTKLCDALCRMGALPRIARLPEVAGLKKVGLDDFIVAKGEDAFREVLDAAEPAGASRELWRMNSEVCLVRRPVVIVELDTAQKLEERKFHTLYANRQVMVPAKEGEWKPAPAGPAWLGWPARFEVGRMVYRPGDRRKVLEDDDSPNGLAYNTWPGWGCEPEDGPVDRWRRHMELVFGNDPKMGEWFERWLAYPLQHPGAKLRQAVILWSVVHGVGKSMIGYAMREIYGKNFTKIGQKELQSDFNPWQDSKQFVLGEEITGSDNRAYHDALKDIITQDIVRINDKFVPAYEIEDRCNLLLTSNQPSSTYIEDFDRRWAVHELEMEKQDQAYYQGFWRWLKEQRGRNHLFAHLLRLDLGDWDPNAPAPMTEAKERMIEAGRSDLGHWVAKLVSSPDQALRVDGTTAPGDLWTADRLRAYYDPERRTRVTGQGVGIALSKAGVPQVLGRRQVRVEGRTPARYYVVRNKDRWLDPKVTEKEVAKHVLDTHGTRE